MNTKPEATNEMRAAFEAEYGYMGQELFLRDEDGYYEGQWASSNYSVWEAAWLASRADAGTSPKPAPDDVERAARAIHELCDTLPETSAIKGPLFSQRQALAKHIIATLRPSEEVQRLRDMEQALRMMDEVAPCKSRVFTDHGHYCSLVEVAGAIEVNGVVVPLSCSKTHIIYKKSAMSEKRGLQIIRFSRGANEEKWRLASNPYSGVYLMPHEWEIVFDMAFRVQEAK